MSNNRPLPTAPAYGDYDNSHYKSTDDIYESLDETNTYVNLKDAKTAQERGGITSAHSTGSTRKKKIMIGCAILVLVLILIVGGVVLGVILTKDDYVTDGQGSSQTMAPVEQPTTASLSTASMVTSYSPPSPSATPSAILPSTSPSTSPILPSTSPSTSPVQTPSQTPKPSVSASATPTRSPTPSPKYCNKGCTQTMIGNDVCDNVCDTASCGWDGGDCDNDISALDNLSGELQDKELVIVPKKVIEGHNDRIIDLFDMGMDTSARVMFNRCMVECERWTRCKSFEIVVDKKLCTLAKVSPEEEGVELKDDDHAALGYS